jgi:hypothetical protein
MNRAFVAHPFLDDGGLNLFDQISEISDRYATEAKAFKTPPREQRLRSSSRLSVSLSPLVRTLKASSSLSTPAPEAFKTLADLRAEFATALPLPVPALALPPSMARRLEVHLDRDEMFSNHLRAYLTPPCLIFPLFARLFSP